MCELLFTARVNIDTRKMSKRFHFNQVKLGAVNTDNMKTFETLIAERNHTKVNGNFHSYTFKYRPSHLF